MSKKILVVDDNRMMVSFITRTLERDGHQVLSAEDGESALEILKSFVPDIMFIDLIMPGIRGDEVCRKVREMPHLRACYLVIISGSVDEMELDYKKIGANSSIAKGPFGEMGDHILATVKASDSHGKDHG